MAGCIALASFAIAVLSGLLAENPATVILVRALLAMVICYPIGFMIGLVCERIIVDHTARNAESRPIPVSRGDEQPTGADTSLQEEEEPIVI